jgi:alpha-glucosidase (family GH31 glycosyl hydrolase)
MEYFQAMRSAYDLRYALLPYIYTSARQAYDTGISICRPLYYDWPKNQEAYTYKNEYMFGDSLLVNPVVAPIEAGKKFVMQKTWLPKGRWIEYETGKVFDGPAVIERPFALNEIPVYVKSGAIIPTVSNIKRVDEKQFDSLILNIYPGPKGSISFYSDRGNDNNFKIGQCAFTDINSIYDGTKTVITIDPVRGGYENMPALRDYQLRLINTFPPKSVTINEEKISYSANSADSSYTYDGGEVTTVIYTGKQDVNKKITIIIEHDNADPAILSGVKGKLKHLRNFVDFVGRGPEPL